MKKLKGMNLKQFFANHFEKVLFGLVVLAGLGAVATSRWSPYDEKNPRDLIEQVEQAEAQHKVSTWPVDQQEEYANVEDISAKADALLSPLPIQEFAFSESLSGMFRPVIDMQQPIGEIEWLPVDQMVADAGRVLILQMPEFDPTMMAQGMMPEGGMMPGMGMMSGGAYPGMVGQMGQMGFGGQGGAQEAPNPFTPKLGGGMGMGGLGMEGGMYGPGAPGMAPGVGGTAGAAGVAGPGARGAAGRNAAGGPGMMPEEMAMAGMEGGMMTNQYANREGEGKRFVSVRGVFPLKRQEEILAEAMNLRSMAEATQRLMFLDYEIERQVAQPGDDPWSGPWEDVDVSIAEDTLRDSMGTEAVIYDQSVTSPIFTMPLPARGMGMWLPEMVSHPVLEAETFSKTDLGKEQEAWLQQKIAEYKAQMEELEQTQVRQGGWASFGVTNQAIGQEMMSDQRFMGQLQGELNQEMQREGTFRPGRQVDIKTQIQQMITASGAYLLFRYLDFDVKPGYAYRYRVRIQVANPAYGLEVPVVERPDIAEGATRWTEWSQPTPPSIVPRDTRHYLASIDPGNIRTPPRAQFDMFQWSEENAGLVNQTLPVMAGNGIGGSLETTVINPLKMTSEPESVKFQSGDVLVDIDMGLNTGAGRGNREGEGATYEVPDRVILVNDWGGLEVMDKYSREEEHEKNEEDYELFVSALDPIINPPQPTGQEGMIPGEEGMMLEGQAAPGGRGGQRGRGGRGGQPRGRGGP